MNDGFYRAFEEKYRGPRELIKSRLQVYLPFVKPLLSFYPNAKAIDLGCGRGEWLELLKENGFQSYGVDLDQGMLAACHERNLQVATKDAIEALQELADASQVVVSGFHIVEHIPFSQLQVLVQESLRVLQPGGLLIMETPNPENMLVATKNFYLDPTHTRPIPPELLAFLPEYYGYGRIKLMRLQEQSSLLAGERLHLVDVLGGVSPDYAVIAQKNAAPEILEATSSPFENDYGITFGVLATRYDQALVDSIDRSEAVARSAESRSQQAETTARTAQSHSEQAVAFAQSMEQRVGQIAAELHTVYASRSWRMTKPLRWLNLQGQLLRQHGVAGRTKAVVKKLSRLFLAHAVLYVNNRPRLRSYCVRTAQKWGLYPLLRSLYHDLSFRGTVKQVALQLKLYVSRRPRLRAAVFFVLKPFPTLTAHLKLLGRQSSPPAPSFTDQHDQVTHNLSPRARKIYRDLTAAIESRKKENDGCVSS